MRWAAKRRVRASAYRSNVLTCGFILTRSHRVETVSFDLNLLSSIEATPSTEASRGTYLVGKNVIGSFLKYVADDKEVRQYRKASGLPSLIALSSGPFVHGDEKIIAI